MPPTPNQIRELLLKSTDKDANVVDMGNVVKAITYLEKSQITKDALEETRLGKTVNDIRKKTKNKELATRCKALVRLWQKQFVRSSQQNTPTSGSSDGASSHPLTSSSVSTPTGRPPSRGQQATTSSVDKTRTENRKRRKPDSPGSASNSPTAELHPAKRSSGRVSSLLGSDSTDSSINGLPGQVASGNSAKSAFTKVTPKTRSVSPRVASKSETKTRKAALKGGGGERSGRASPAGESKVQGKNSRSSSPAVLNRTTQSKKRSPNVSMPKVEKATEKPPSKSTASPKVSKSSLESQSASGRKFVATEKSNSPTTTTTANERAKSPRVNSKKNSLLGNRLSPSVQPNSKKLEDGNSSVATVKLRDSPTPAATSSPSFESASTKQSASSTTQSDDTSGKVPKAQPEYKSITRTESSKKTFKTMKSIFDDDSSDDDGEYNAEIPDPVNSFSLVSPTRISPEIDSDENNGTEPPTLTGSNGSESPVPKAASVADTSSHTSQIHEKLEDDEDEEEVVVKKPVTQDDVKKLHNDRWEGVNGCFNDQGEWYDWTQCLSVLLNEEEPPLHILPYVTLL